MKGSETKLVSYMQGSDKRFVIPVYQRNYDWKTENCKQLYDDLIKVIRRGRKSHFFGSIVSVHNDGEFNEYLVIDGQQRLTTISLLLLAMYSLMKNGVLTPEKGNLAEKIYKTYLIDEWQDDDTRIKLKPVKNDRNAFGKLFDEESEHIPDSNLTINYNYFYSRIQKEEITIDELYEAVTKLEIINITLNQDDNPQLIFESLNSTGVALSEGDKIRNFILMGLPTKQQNDFYEKYWNKIEICTDYDVSMFVRDYLSVKQQLIPSMSKVYFTFKAFVEENGTEIEPLLQELLNYAKWYEILLKGNTADKGLNACIYRLNRLETTVTRPFFLEVLRLQAAGKLSLAEVKEIFLYTENYLFRRTICDLPTNALNKIFLMLHREIIRYDGTDNSYLEKFKYALNFKSDRGRFPDDGEFVDAFAARPVYQMNSKNKIYILERFENYGTVEVQNVYKQCDDGVYSIEHIMPQHLTPAWVKELGEDYEEIHDTWLHRMANLTLTGYNSKYSNSAFVEKRDMKNGFIDSHLYMNSWIGQQEHWGLAELEARSQMLMQRALTIWPLPVTEFKPAEKQMDSYSLDDDVELSGRDIVRFGYKNTEQPVTSWIDMMEQILKILHAEDKSVLSRLAYSKGESNDLDAYVSNKPQDLRNALQIDTDIYVERNTSTSTKISMLRRFFKAYGANEEDLVFYLKDVNDDGTAQEAGTRYELRRRYWAFALPYIQQAHDDGTGRGCFSGCTTSKENWLSGFFGIGGFSLVCVANYNKARVDLTLAHSNKDRNKEAFDYLYSYKSEMFLVTVLVMNTAKKRQKLDNNIFQVQGIAQKYNCSLRPLDYQQEEGLMSCIPLGVNRIEIQRGLTTSATAIFVPFTTQELFQEGEALYYGLNALSNNMIMVDRKRLKNPNGLILGTPGSGKSFSAKREITNCFLITEDDIIICDPEAEYYPLVQALHGQVVRISPVSTQYINPMDLNLNYSEEDNPLSLKSDFILSLCELIVGGKNGLEPVEKTIIDRCVRLVYQEYLSDPVPEKMPILQNLYDLLRGQDEPEAQRLATALEIYVTGSLNVFNHRTNVDINSRIICFDIKELGKQLKKIGMLIVQDQVWNRVTVNRSAHKSTRYYVDEFHLLLKEEQTAAYSVEIWKRFRKWGGIPTGITQNIKDLLASREIENIFENSDFIYMLNQASGDRQILAKQLNISPTQLSYVTNSNEGEGLLFYGNVIIPFVDRFPKNKLYQLLTTRPEETGDQA